MRVRVKQTTDGKFIGQVFSLPDNPTLDDITIATGGMFHPEQILSLPNGDLRIFNTNYTAIVERI